MVYVEGGTFDMGDTFGEGYPDEWPVHPVTVRPFYLGRYAVTFDEYDAFCEATGREKPDDKGWGRGSRPVIHVNWFDAVDYCNWRSDQEEFKRCYTIEEDEVSWDMSADGYRLPTEAEWEYAAREGGRKVRFGNGGDIADPDAMNYDGSGDHVQPYSVPGVFLGMTLPVGSFRPNALGLYDMTGNVWEWCWDWYDNKYYANSPASDPAGAISGQNRVLRGGSWVSGTRNSRVTIRGRSIPEYRFHSYGFRRARSILRSGTNPE